NDEVRDAYWTLVGYFNSLRLLAAAELQVHSDVDERLNFLSKREDVKPREVREQSELTSRASATEVPERLKLLDRQYPNACHGMLARNMIPFGVAVDGLGLLAVRGQPQTTAEYIQSTTRAGANTPGWSSPCSTRPARGTAPITKTSRGSI